MKDLSRRPGDLWFMGVHSREPQHNRKVLGDCDKEKDLFPVANAHSEKKWCGTVDHKVTHWVPH